MTFATVACPSCGTRITVSGNAPPRLRCPRCFGVVERPEAHEAIGGQGVPPPIPVPVIPLDRQVSSDSSVSRSVLIVVGLLIVVGFALVCVTTGVRGAGGFLVLSVVVAGVLAYLLTSAIRIGSGSAGEPASRYTVAARPGEALAYWAPASPGGGGGDILGGALGCLASVVYGCGGLWGIAQVTQGFSGGNQSALILTIMLLVGLPVAFLYLSFRWGFRGFAIGFIGGVLMAVLALGFCFMIVAGPGLLHL